MASEPPPTSSSVMSAISFYNLFNNEISSTSEPEPRRRPLARSTLLSEVETSYTHVYFSAIGDRNCSGAGSSSGNVVSTRATSILVNHVRPDTAAGHQKYLHNLVEVITTMGQKDGFSNKTQNGQKITYETFFDAKKLTSEVVHRAIVMLLVNFGFISKDEIKNGFLKEHWEQLEGSYFHVSGVNPPQTDCTLDALHHKILNRFFRHSDSVGRYYDASVLLFPALDLKKTRTALSYLMRYCTIAIELAESTIDPKKDLRDKKVAAQKRNDALRAEVEKQKEIATQLKTELDEIQQLQKQNTPSPPAAAEMTNWTSEEIDAAIMKARDELQVLECEIQKKKFVAQPSASTATASSSKKGATEDSTSAKVAQVDSSSKGGLKVKSSKAEHFKKSDKSGCQNRYQHIKAAITVAQAKNISMEVAIERCGKLIKAMQEHEENLKAAKARKENEEINYEKAKEITVRVKQLEKEIENNRKRHHNMMEGLRWQLALNERKLAHEKEKGHELDKKLAELVQGLSLELEDDSNK